MWEFGKGHVRLARAQRMKGGKPASGYCFVPYAPLLFSERSAKFASCKFLLVAHNFSSPRSDDQIQMGSTRGCNLKRALDLRSGCPFFGFTNDSRVSYLDKVYTIKCMIPTYVDGNLTSRICPFSPRTPEGRGLCIISEPGSRGASPDCKSRRASASNFSCRRLIARVSASDHGPAVNNQRQRQNVPIFMGAHSLRHSYSLRAHVGTCSPRCSAGNAALLCVGYRLTIPELECQ